MFSKPQPIRSSSQQGHNRRAKDFTAGQKTKNPGRCDQFVWSGTRLTGRKFYVCPLAKDDPEKCKFFKWADELAGDGTEKSPGTASRGGAAEIIAAAKERYGGTSAHAPQSFGGAGQSLGGPPRELGQGPQSRLSRQAPPAVTTPNASRIAPITPQTSSRIAVTLPEEEADDIDWDKVDADSLERDAIASTPGSSQRTNGNSETLQDRLLAVSPLAAGKRKRDDVNDENDDTPKVDRTPKKPVPGGDDVSLREMADFMPSIGSGLPEECLIPESFHLPFTVHFTPAPRSVPLALIF